MVDVIREDDSGWSTQNSTGNTLEPDLDNFLQFCLEVGHVTPGYPGKTYPLAFCAVMADHAPKSQTRFSSSVLLSSSVSVCLVSPIWRDQPLCPS